MFKCQTKECKPCNETDYEQGMRNFVCDWLDRHQATVKGLAIDAGAHTGLWSLFLDKIYPIEHKIIAIEADRENYMTLCLNVNNNISCFHNAVWNREQLLGLHKDRHCARHYVTKDLNRDVNRASGITIDWLIGNRQVDVLKLDVEGAEYQALQGAEQTLQFNDMLLVVEFCSEHLKRFGASKEKLLKFLTDCGYSFARAVDKLNYYRLEEETVKLLAFTKW